MDWSELGPEGLAFVGRITASVSHELKNSLALINENAGLMQDLLAMAERGRPLDQAMLATASERIGRHVARANATIGNLNRFAHLADHPLRQVDVTEETALCVALHHRPASQREVRLVLAPAAGEIRVRTRPLLFADALHQCLMLAIGGAAGGELTISTAGVPGGAEVRISGLAPDACPPRDAAGGLFAAVGAEVRCEGGELVLSMGDVPDHTAS